MSACKHPDQGRRLFCSICGKVTDRDALKTVRFKGFTGRATTNENIQRALATGDPTGL